MPPGRNSPAAKSPDDLRRYQDLVETSQDLIWQSDAQGRYTYLNPAWEATCGYRIEEMLGKTLSDFQSPDTAERDTRELTRLMRAGTVNGYETICIGKSGRPIHLALYARPVCDEHGQVTGTRGTAHDITERSQVTEAWARSAHEWQKTFDATLDAIWVLDRDHRIVRSNRMAQQMFDRPSSAMIGRHCWEIVHGTAGPIPECPALRARNSLRRESMQLQLGQRWVAVYVDPILDEGDNYSGSVHIVSDITERKQGEQALRESEERFRKIVERAPIAMAIVSMDGVIELINQKAVEVFGYLSKDIPTMERWWVQAYPDQDYREEVVALWTALVQKAVREGQEIPGREYRVTCKDGTIKTILISGVPIPDRIFVLFDDLSERKRAEARLQKALDRLDLATSAARLGIWDWDIAKNELVWDDRMYELYGINKADFAGAYQAWLAGVHPDDRAIADRASQAAVRGEREYDTEFRVVWPDGTVRHLHAYGVITRAPNGRPLRMTGTNYDTTARRQTEEALRASESRYRALVDSSPDAITQSDLSGTITMCNRQTALLHGYERPEDMIGKSAFELFPPDELERAQMHLRRTLSEGVIRNAEYRFLKKDGSQFHGELSATLISDAAGRPSSFVALTRNVDQRKRAENLLAIQHSLAVALNTTSSLETWLGLCLDAATSASEMDCGGIYLGDETGDGLRLIVHKGLSPAFVSSASHFDTQSPSSLLVMAGQPVYSEHTHLNIPLDDNRRQEGLRAIAVIPVTCEGRILGCLNLASHARDDVPVFARRGLETIAAQIGTGIARLKTEEALRESNEKFAKVFRTSPDAITITRLSDGTYLEVNQSFTDTAGFTPEETLGRSSLPGGVALWINEEDRIRMVYGLKVHGKVVGMEARLRMKSGATCTALLSARILELGGEACILTVARDITERKRMEEALYESEQHYKMVSELATDYVYKLGIAADGQVTMDFVSDNFYSLTGRTKEDAKTVDLWSGIIHPDDLGKVVGLLRKLVAKPQSTELECRSYVHGGKPRWVSIVARSEWDERQQRVTAIVGAVKDISERKRAEEAIAAEKERLAVTLRSIGDGVITTDITGAVVIVNRVAEELTGWTQNEAEGKPLATVFRIVNETTQQPCENPVDRVLSMGRGFELATHTLLTSRDGTERVIADSGAPIRGADGSTMGVVLVFRDVTERQKTVEAMQRAAKLDSLGVLAGGIAHDFNNLLTGIFGYVELARSESKEAGTIEYLEATRATMNRAKALTLQLLTFAKGGAPAQKPTSLVPFIEEAVQFALSGGSVACRFSFAEDVWPCNIDKNQIAQVIDNIVINAQQAMPNGGVIGVAAENVLAEEGEYPGLASGRYVRVSIKDQGIGIPKDVLPRIFDPFYTTKTKGHGLGLATCYSIVSRHGGCIDVESEPGRGSTFHVYLPAATQVVVVEAPAVVKHEGSGRVIVADDEVVIRETIRKMVESLGYSVVCARDGREAIDLYVEETRAGRRVGAMILDLTIRGGMGGKEAVAELRRFDRELPVFVASGYADDPVMRNPAEYGFSGSLGKPFTIAELSDVLKGSWRE